MALAARRDTQQAWGDRLAQCVTSWDESWKGEEQVLNPGVLLLSLCYVARRLEATPVLQGSLLRIWNERASQESEAALAAMAVCLLGADSGNTPKPDVVQALVVKGLHPAVGAMVDLSIARVHVDRRKAVQRALANIGSDEWLDHASWGGLEAVADTSLDAKVVSEVKKALSSSSRTVRLGGVRVVRVMGPDAQDLLPELKLLVISRDEKLALEAREAYVAVGGVGAQGKWVHQESARALGWE